MKKISCLFTGDVTVHKDQLEVAFNNDKKAYDFSDYFKNIEQYIYNTDIAVCNLETTIAGGVPTGYPRFNAPEELIDAIKNAGFKCVAAANNHSFDSKAVGIIKTKDAIEKCSLEVIGIRRSIEDKAYKVIDVNGVKVGFFNYTYETSKTNGFRTLNNRVFPEDAARLLNSLSFESIEDDIKVLEHEINCAREEGAQVIIVCYHWGNRYEKHSNVFQKYVAWKTANLGADAIIGTHTHMPQEISEISVKRNGKKKKVPVFYSLGNYICAEVPIRQCENVLHNMLALLDIELDEASGDVRVTPSYIPMLIVNEQNRFYTLDVQQIPKAQYAAFTEKIGKNPQDVIAEIKSIAENRIYPVKVKMYFKNIFRLKTGERVSFSRFLPKNKYMYFLSEDAVVASVTQNAYIIGNTAGYVGITAVDEKGIETVFIAQVIEGEKSTFPVLVNEYNSVRDSYNPPGLLSAEKTGLPAGIMLCSSAFYAWKQMCICASKQKIYLKVVSGFRSKKLQILRTNKYAKARGVNAAELRYQRFGHTEHHLGCCVDVSGDLYNEVETSKIMAIKWVQQNCYKFGFVARVITSDLSKKSYVHLRYFENKELAYYLAHNAVTLEEYLSDYEIHLQRFNKLYGWKNNYIAPEDDSATLSLFKICSIIGIQVPGQFKEIQHRVVPQILFNDSVKTQQGSIFFYDKKMKGSKQSCLNSLRSGSVLAFSERQIKDESKNAFPTIIVDEPAKACIKVGRFICSKYKAKSVCVTGSLGKTTVCELVNCILSVKFNTHFSNQSNSGERVNILQTIQELEEQHEMYVQEVSGCFEQYIAENSQMLNPDIAVITNIGTEHIELYKNRENIQKDKLSILDSKKPDGVGVINIDDACLKERYEFSSDGLVTFSIKDSAADYSASDIHHSPDGLHFTVCEKSTGVQTEIKTTLMGANNVCNILAAFAVGRLSEMSHTEIALAIESYRPWAVRQDLKRVGSYCLLADSSLMNEKSVIYSMQLLHEIKTPSTVKKIAVIGELMFYDNKKAQALSRVADAVRDLDIDHILVFGKNTKSFAAQLKKGKQDVRCTESCQQLIEWIQMLASPEDVILFKGHFSQSVILAMDCSFGTAYSINNDPERKVKAIEFKEGAFSGIILHDKVAIIDKYLSSETEVEIPGYIQGKPVVTVNCSSFVKNKIQKINLGEQTVSVQNEAFKDCAQLESVEFGERLCFIGNGAFKNCSSLKKISLPCACTHISKQAFAGCSELECVEISENVLFIADDAFEACSKLKIIAPIDSFAYKYAMEHGFLI